MIPWSEVDGTNRYKDAIYPVDLQEHWLRLVENGPTMAAWTLDSPMLELAHERQFVVSQQGGNSVGFEREHVDRIKICMAVLDQTFHHGAGWKQCHLHDPPEVGHVGLWVDDQFLDSPTELDFPEDESMVDAPELSPNKIDHSSVTVICTPLQHPCRSSSPSPVGVVGTTTNEEARNIMHRSAIRFSRATDASRTTQSQPVRALKPVRLRKRLGDQKKQVLSNGIQKVNHIQVLSNKSCLHRSEDLRTALLLASANSLSTPPASSPEDSDHDHFGT